MNANGNTVSTLDVSLVNNTNVTASGNALDAQTGGIGGELILTLDDVEFTSTSGLGINIDGSAMGAGPITITDFDEIDVYGTGGGTGGIVINTATFDDSPGGSISEVNSSRVTIGSTAASVQGDGLSMIDVSGALEIDDLDIWNNGGTGLLVDTKNGSTIFSLDIDTSSSGSSNITTTNGTALDLDPLTVDIEFATVSSTGAEGNGITLDTVSGDIDITLATIENAGADGISLDNVDATVDFTLANIENANANGVSVNNSDGDVTFTTLNVDGATVGIQLVGQSGNENASFTANGGTIENIATDGAKDRKSVV